MSAARTPESLRREQVEISRLAWAFALSLLLHLLMFGGFQMGKQLGWWQRVHWPTWIQLRKPLAQNLIKQPNKSLAQEEVPLIFLEVSPQQATPEPPKKAKFYSSQNSRAANKESEQETATPKIDGK